MGEERLDPGFCLARRCGQVVTRWRCLRNAQKSSSGTGVPWTSLTIERSVRQSPRAPSLMNPVVATRWLKSAASRAERAVSSSEQRSPSSRLLPRQVTIANWSTSRWKAPPAAKSAQKSRMVFRHSSSATLIRNVRFTWHTRRRWGPVGSLHEDIVGGPAKVLGLEVHLRDETARAGYHRRAAERGMMCPRAVRRASRHRPSRQGSTLKCAWACDLSSWHEGRST